jgi:transcriptional regulator GlxA family with amidase domain
MSERSIAAIAGLERTYFSAYFRKKVGVRFVDWVAVVRVRAAIELLLQSDASVTDVAYSTGFGDVRSFERAFKRQTSLTAREFKRRYCPPSKTVATFPNNAGTEPPHFA